MKQGALSRCVAVFAVAAFFWTIALSVAPELHQRIHTGQTGADHSCAVTFVGSGSYLHAPAAAAPGVARFEMEFTALPEMVPCWVPSPFLAGAVFEHAPPSRS